MARLTTKILGFIQLPGRCRSNRFLPKVAELGRDDLIVGNRCREQADVLGETVHKTNGFFSNGWIVVGEITPDQFGNEFRFGRRKALLPHFRSPTDILFERFVSFHDGPDCRSRDGGGTWCRTP